MKKVKFIKNNSYRLLKYKNFLDWLFGNFDIYNIFFEKYYWKMINFNVSFDKKSVTFQIIINI